MALDAATAQEMVRKLAEDRSNYLNTLNRAHDLLAEALTAAAGGRLPPRLPTDSDANTIITDVASGGWSVEDESITDDDESLFVQQPLPQEEYTHEGLRKHIKLHRWTQSGRAILGNLLNNNKFLGQDCLFPVRLGSVEDRSHLSHYSIFDVGNDGSPLQRRNASDSRPCSRAMAIWRNLKDVNSDPNRARYAVGKIAIVREPSPVLFAALHYTMNDHFDMDEIFQLLVDAKTMALPHRPFSPNPKHQSTFLFSLDYFTVIGDECQPMDWQKADEEANNVETHVPISRCSSVIGLSLSGKPVSEIHNKGRRADRKTGNILDPFAPWRVLSIQAYPDWKSSVDSHDSTKHYVNGPEAFLVTLKAEFKDAQKRLLKVNESISDLVRPPPNFMFNSEMRDKLLFEDDDFTYSRKYFWAHQSLGIMNEDIEEMMTAYKTTFTDNVWNGVNKIIWPGDASTSSRYSNWRKRMVVLRKDIEHELHKLEDIGRLNDAKMKEIKALRDNLFSGTSVLESRRSVRQAEITVQQGHNIKLLTLVTIFFLPLTFATSIFGMTNMPPNDNFKPFGIVIVIICVPTYMLIGSLNTTSGLKFWSHKTNVFFSQIGHLFAATFARLGYKPKWTHVYQAKLVPEPALDPNYVLARKKRSQSASDGMAARSGDGGFGPSSLLGAHTISMSSAPTLDRQSNLGVPANPVIKFEERFSDMPRTPIEKAGSVNIELQARNASGSDAGMLPLGLRNDEAGGANWWSRLLNRDRKGKSTGDEGRIVNV